ncbi:CATRA conflict system CASPASE/TPR repeat-associated protein [Actinoplanes sp. NPDC026670]|uniref:CATRA conflict system CASPASE/TPR repeat-associated protein n=1 Tax=Actinoplanes sp. NPDC026670 TaxID=3154700 RepID=UPI0033E91104
MPTDRLVEPELVAHLFLPLDGPEAAAALAGAWELWANCRGQLGMTQPIVEAGLPGELPDDPAAGPEGALAGLQDPAVRYQVVARREHDVLNVSFAFAAAEAAAHSRYASATPPGWHEYTRWWNGLRGGTAALGGAVVYLAKTPDAGAVDIRAEVPRQDDDADSWWTGGYPLGGFAAWEVSAAGVHAFRRLALLAGPEQDRQLSELAWGDGSTALPPLGRYLLHAAKLRYAARVLGDGGRLARLRKRTDGHREEISRLLGEPRSRAEAARRSGALAADESEVVGAVGALRTMAQSVAIARANMDRALPGPLPADAELGAWLTAQIAVETELMEATREQAERIRLIIGAAIPGRPEPELPVLPHRPVTPGVEHRVAFNVDVVNYSARTSPAQTEVQRRLSGLAGQVLAGLGLKLHDTDRQQSGDGILVVLPASVPSHTALPALLHGWRRHLAVDNAGHPEERIRLRLSVGAGPFTEGATGFVGRAVIEIGRLLDSDVLRRAVTGHPEADVVAGITDRLHQDVVAEGYPGLDSGDFEPADFTVKTFTGRAWLWTGAAAPHPAPDGAAPSRPRQGAGEQLP